MPALWYANPSCDLLADRAFGASKETAHSGAPTGGAPTGHLLTGGCFGSVIDGEADFHLTGASANESPKLLSALTCPGSKTC